MPGDQEQHRLSILINDEAVEFIDEVVREDGISVTELIRRSLATYKLVREARLHGLERVQYGLPLSEILGLPEWRREE